MSARETQQHTASLHAPPTQPGAAARLLPQATAVNAPSSGAIDNSAGAARNAPKPLPASVSEMKRCKCSIPMPVPVTLPPAPPAAQSITAPAAALAGAATGDSASTASVGGVANSATAPQAGTATVRREESLANAVGGSTVSGNDVPVYNLNTISGPQLPSLSCDDSGQQRPRPASTTHRDSKGRFRPKSELDVSAASPANTHTSLASDGKSALPTLSTSMASNSADEASIESAEELECSEKGLTSGGGDSSPNPFGKIASIRPSDSFTFPTHPQPTSQQQSGGKKQKTGRPRGRPPLNKGSAQVFANVTDAAQQGQELKEPCASQESILVCKRCRGFITERRAKNTGYFGKFVFPEQEKSEPVRESTERSQGCEKQLWRPSELNTRAATVAR